jgi:anti-sigma B factor antagonist
MIRKEDKNGITIISFTDTDKITAINSEELKNELNPLFENTQGCKLLMDFEGIDFVDSSGFGAFLSVMKTAGRNGGSLKLCNLKPEVVKLFKLLHLDHVFDIYSTTEEAINDFE